MKLSGHGRGFPEKKYRFDCALTGHLPVTSLKVGERRKPMTFKERLDSGRFAVAVELQPPKGNDLSELYEYAELLKGRVDAINVPDLQNAIMRLGSLSVCTLLKAKRGWR